MNKQIIRIGRHKVGNGQPVFVIAEAGVNHNGRLDLALKLIDAAAKAGADAVKFQTFRAEDVVIGSGKMAAYQKKNIGKTESQLAMLKKLELKESWYPKLIARCHARRILFLSTPHGGIPSVKFLARFRPAAYKFGSGDLTNIPLLEVAARFRQPMIVSTGMATLAEVRAAVRAIRRAGNPQIIVLHATTNYPCPDREVNMRAMQTMRETLNVLVGYSDHTPDIQVSIMAATLGACVIEKHFTLDRAMTGPDHRASLEPEELRVMVEAVRRVPTILGSDKKRPSASEITIAKEVRKSLVTLCSMKKDERFTEKNLGIKRPGRGLTPGLFHDVIGRRAARPVARDVLLRSEDIA